jgi:GT2 family glycosyltransferase
MHKRAIKYSVVILSYNNYDRVTKKCLESVVRNIDPSNTEIIIVDNFSQDDSDLKIESFIGNCDNSIDIKFHKCDENYGYAKGNNLGIKLTSGDYIVLLNNDTIVGPGWLDELCETFQFNKSLGLCGPISNSVGNEQQIILPLLNDENFIEKFGQYSHALWPKYNLTTDLGFFCVMIKRDVINKIGYLDENFGIGMFEDTDYCARAKNSGFNLAFTQKVFIYHYGSFSFKKITSAEYAEIFNRNLDYFISKHGVGQWGISLILRNFWLMHKRLILEYDGQDMVEQLKMRVLSFDSLIDTLIQLESKNKINYIG